MSNSFDFEQFKANAIEQLKAGVPLSDKDGVLAPLLENLFNSALEGEMDSHLEGGEREIGQPPQRSYEQAGSDFDGRSDHKHTARPGRHF